MKFYPNIFDIIDYDDEFEYDIKEELNLVNQLDSIGDNIQQEEENRELEENFNIKSNDSQDQNEKTSTEQILSQQMSQLSTISGDYEEEEILIDGKRRRILLTTSVKPITKKLRTNAEDENNVSESELMPPYLLERNQLFDRMIQNLLNNISPMNIDDLRQIAFYIHQMDNYKTLHDLWTTYLQAGIGYFNIDEDEQEKRSVSLQIDRRYWSNDVELLIGTKSNLNLSNMTMEKKQKTYEDIVYEQLHEFNEKIQLYENLFSDKKLHLTQWSSTIHEAIKIFVSQYGIIPLQMIYTYKVTILKYEYKDLLLQRQYEQQKPTNYQKQIAQYLYDIQLKLETTKKQLIECQERILCNKPPILYDCLEVSYPFSIDTIILNSHLGQLLLNRYEKLIQQTKLDFLSIYIASLQTNINQYETLLNKETDSMWKNYHQSLKQPQQEISNNKMTKILTQLITKRSLNMIEKFKAMCHFTIDYYIRSSYDKLELNKKEKENDLKRIGFSPTILINSTARISQLTKQQLQLLNRGPCYMPPGQLHISPSFTTIDTLVKKQYASLKHQFALIFDKYKINLSRQTYFYNKIWADFQQLYSLPLPVEIDDRATYETKLIQSIQYFLKENNLILRRTADQKNTFYLGNLEEFIEKSNQYMKDSLNYTVLINDVNETNRQSIQYQLEQKFELLNKELNKLVMTKKLTEEMFNRLRINLNQIQIPYLYFLPNFSMTNSLQVKPMISTFRSVTGKIAHFVYHLLRPYVTNILKSSTFLDQADFIQKLQSYTIKEYSLQPTTLFVTIKILNFYTMVSHETIIKELEYFFMDYSTIGKKFQCTSIISDKPQYISMNTIQQLIELFLNNNIFYYDGKIYGFTNGGPHSFLLCELLSNMYLFKWQKIIFSEDFKFQTEFSGRYKDQLFFTWNRSEDELDIFLKTITGKSHHLHLETYIDKCVPFLNAYIENNNGQLRTSVYHDPHIQKYTLPYVVGNIKLKHSLWFRSALIRAVHCCSHYTDFLREQTYLQMTYLTNGYSMNFIEMQLKHFYHSFNAVKIRYCFDQTTYEQFRHQLFDFMIQQYEKYDRLVKLEDIKHIIHFYYPFDYGSYTKFNEKFYEHWKTHIKDDPNLPSENIEISLNANYIYTLNALLTEQYSSVQFLKKHQ